MGDDGPGHRRGPVLHHGAGRRPRTAGPGAAGTCARRPPGEDHRADRRGRGLGQEIDAVLSVPPAAFKALSQAELRATARPAGQNPGGSRARDVPATKVAAGSRVLTAWSRYAMATSRNWPAPSNVGRMCGRGGTRASSSRRASCQVVRRDRRGARRVLRGAARRGLRVAGAQRRRQDDDRGDPRGIPRSEQRAGRDARGRPGRPAARSAGCAPASVSCSRSWRSSRTTACARS